MICDAIDCPICQQPLIREKGMGAAIFCKRCYDIFLTDEEFYLVISGYHFTNDINEGLRVLFEREEVVTKLSGNKYELASEWILDCKSVHDDIIQARIFL
jgi:hypothetical protein